MGSNEAKSGSTYVKHAIDSRKLCDMFFLVVFILRRRFLIFLAFYFLSSSLVKPVMSEYIMMMIDEPKFENLVP